MTVSQIDPVVITQAQYTPENKSPFLSLFNNN